MGSVTIKWYALLIIIIISELADTNNTSTTKKPATSKTSTSKTAPKPKAAKPKAAKPKKPSTPRVEVVNALKHLSFRNYPYTFQWPTMPDNHVILAGPTNKHNITYFWFDFYGPSYRKPSNYVMCKYNHTNTSLTIIPPPCGSVPSMKCLSEMINISLHNDTGEETCNLTTTFNPMLYNVPRWVTKIYLGEDYTLMDSQTIYFLGLSEAIFRNLLRHNCTKSFYLTNAMSRNLFRAPKISLWKLKQGMRRLKRKQKPERESAQKTKKRNKRSNNSTTTMTPTITTETYNKTEPNTTILVNTSDTLNFKPPVIITQLQNMVTFIYTTLRYAQKPFCDEKRDRNRQSAWANHTRQILYNHTVETIHGDINLTNLYNQTPTYNTTITNNYFITPLWDYIDSLAFKEQIRLNNSNLQTYQRHTNLSLSILPP